MVLSPAADVERIRLDEFFPLGSAEGSSEERKSTSTVEAEAF